MATTLNKGDIAVIQFNSDTPVGADLEGDGFTFVLLADVDATTSINFTDAGFNTAGVIINDTAVHEGTRTWTSGQALSAGTVVRIYDGVPSDASHGHQTASVGTVTSTGPNSGLASSGDQIFVYQGAVASTGQSPNLLFGLNFGDADNAANPLLANGWHTNPPVHNGITNDNNESQLPSSLIGYEVGFTPEVDNGYYNGTTTGTPASVLAAIMTESNWVTSNSSPTTNPPKAYSNFSVAAPSATPTLDTNTGSTVAEDGHDIVTTSELETNDTDTADSNLTYTLDSTVTNGTLYLDNDGSNTFNAGDTTLLAASTFTQQNIADGDLQYKHNGGETVSDSFQFDLSDGPNQIVNQTFNFTVTPVNDAAVITGYGGDVSAFNELFGGPVAIESGGDVVVTDSDDANFNGGTLTVSFTGGLSEDQLSINNGGATGIGVAGGGVFFNSVQFGTVAGGTNGSNLVVTFTTATATPSVIADLVEALRYDNSDADNPTGGARTINIVLNDGSDNSSSVAATVNVTAVNDAPSV
ncbi:cadherin-like domain-containing protein, partial [Phaeobacter sp. NW0010-22]|uniref:cadherin-like domain-containing protein n=1 Tax=Phaeobacter sp. NW0010-22 TaxID=3135907 RepID=UPI003340BAC0